MSDLRTEVNEAIDGTDGQAHAIAVGVRPLALAIVGAVEALAGDGAAIRIEIDTETLGDALERGLDSMARDVKDGLETGLGAIEVAVRGLER